ncbi:MAG: 23S rRNA (adenine(2503)-C(2))-methyltransferase RlmN [bacterium]
MISDSPFSAWGILPDEWKPLCIELGIPPFRATQILNGLYQNFATAWQDITTLPKELRDILESRILLKALEVVTVQEAEDGVAKLLLGCADGERIETVLIPSKGRMTQCISTQVGCNFKCAFCASGQYGRVRNLTAAEIVGQVMVACDRMRASEKSPMPTENSPGKKVELPRPGNIVVMGMGEPFDNYDNMIRALKILNNQKGINIGARHITISTCGVIPGIQRLSDEGLQFELSVSLHAPTDELRSQIVPVNKRWPIAELIETCRSYFEKTNRLVTFEYTLVKNLNDRPQHAEALIKLLRKLPCKINLIPLSPVEGFNGERPNDSVCLGFLDTLIKAGFNTTLRKSRGKEVDAACGQLRLRNMT